MLSHVGDILWDAGTTYHDEIGFITTRKCLQESFRRVQAVPTLLY